LSFTTVAYSEIDRIVFHFSALYI